MLIHCWSGGHSERIEHGSVAGENVVPVRGVVVSTVISPVVGCVFGTQ